jgi:hypothetical protein
MKWRKMGHVFRPQGNLWWAREYAHLPTVELRDERSLRVYFASLDENKYGRIGWVDLDAKEPSRILGVAAEPVLDLGELGSFDDCGVVPSCLSDVHHQRFLYYIGFQRTERVPYMLFTGLASVDSSGKCRKLASVPVLDRTIHEPFSRSAPFVLREGGRYRMWYWSCQRWTANGSGVHYNNVIMHATSTDGFCWKSDERPCLEPDRPDEYALGRPSVLRDGDGYKMWFSARSHSNAYRIGFAESADGIYWERRYVEEVITKSNDGGWDSEMVCYPFVIDVGGKRLMFYNGNRHGASGFGYAILEG